MDMTENDTGGRDSAAPINELLAEVDRLGGWVRDRLWGYPGEWDNVMQQVRVTVWRIAERYAPAKGRPDDFVFGIMRRVTMHELGVLGRQRTTLPLIDETMPSADADLLDVHVSEYESSAWMPLIADAATDIEWAVAVELARRDGDVRVVAAELDMTVRTVRAVRDRVRVVARTVVTALDRADSGLAADPRLCLPDVGGLPEAATLLTVPAREAAEALGLTLGTWRNRAALCRRLLAVAAVVFETSGVPVAVPPWPVSRAAA
jgi:DNA-directed RNA polymerase specialized sigma24 family protein